VKLIDESTDVGFKVGHLDRARLLEQGIGLSVGLLGQQGGVELESEI
jgi:hypothetical protein